MNNEPIIIDTTLLCKLTDAVEAAISVGPMDPVHAYDRFAYSKSWHMEPPLDQSMDYTHLQGRRSCAVRAVDAVLQFLNADPKLSNLVRSKTDNADADRVTANDLEA